MGLNVITEDALWPAFSGDLSGYQQTDEKGEPGGYAELDTGGRIPLSQQSLETDIRGRVLGRRTSLSVELVGTQPIVTGTRAVGQTLYWFCPLYVADKIDSPVDDYYALESTDHDGGFGGGNGGIFLRSAPHPTGPWTSRQLLFIDTEYNNETETPSVLYMPHIRPERPFFVYYQTFETGTPGEEAQFTRMKSTADFASFVQEPIRNMLGPASEWANNRLWVDQTDYATFAQHHTGYFNPQLVGSRLISYSRLGGNSQSLGCWSSHDGINWALDAEPLGYSTRYHDDPNLFYTATQFNPFLWRGQHFTFTTAADIVSGARTLALVPLAPDLRTIVGPATTPLTITQPSWETGIVHHVRPFQDIDGAVYVYVTWGSPDGAQNGIATGCYRLVEDVSY